MITCAAPALSQNSSVRACLFQYSNTNTHANMIEIAGHYVLFFMCVSSEVEGILVTLLPVTIAMSTKSYS